MTVEVDIGGRLRVIAVEPIGPADASGDRFRVRMEPGADGGAALVRELEVRMTDLGLSMIDLADRRSIDVAATPGALGEWLIQLPHAAVTATVDGRRWRRGTLDPASGAGVERLLAPMPGRVVRVLVTSGERVEARQGLVVIEAMKMENELTAARAGTVVEVAVTAGMSVESGRLLVRLE